MERKPLIYKGAEIMMFKPSKFNYITYNDNSELLMYNAAIGSSSFCKVLKEQTPEIRGLLSEKIITITDENKNTVQKLMEKGMIVSEERDEDVFCYSSYLKAVNNNYLHLTINPTDKCNFKCIYCYENNKNGNMSEETQSDIISFVRKEIHKYEGLRISWFGGEPLLQMEIIDRLSTEFISICSRLKRSYMATITTNGYLLTKNVFERLLKLKVVHFQITMDGTKETHDRQRPLLNGSGTFDKVFDNLQNIKNYCSHSLYNISLRTNFTKSLFPYIDDYFKLLEDNFMDSNHFDVLIRIAGDWGGERVGLIKENLLDDKYYIRKIITLMQKYKLKFDLMKDMFNPGRNFCYAAQINSYSINAKGEISKCTTDLDNNPFAKIGYISKKGMQINRDQELKWLIKYSDTCSCFFKPVCMGIKCPKAVLTDKYIENSSNACPFEKQYIDELFIMFDKTGLFLVIDV